jgi:hypothetical protein
MPDEKRWTTFRVMSWLKRNGIHWARPELPHAKQQSLGEFLPIPSSKSGGHIEGQTCRHDSTIPTQFLDNPSDLDPSSPITTPVMLPPEHAPQAPLGFCPDVIDSAAVPPSRGDSRCDIRTIVTAIVHAALERIQAPGHDDGIDQPHAQLSGFVTDILRKRLLELETVFVDEMCASHEPALLDIFSDDRRRKAQGDRLQQARSIRAETQAKRALFAQAARERMLKLRSCLLQVSQPTDLTAEPEVEKLKEQLPIIDTGYKLVDAATCLDQFRAELHGLWDVANHKLRRYQECPVTVQFAFLICSLSRPAFRLVRKFIPLPSERTIHNLFDERKNKIASQLIKIGHVSEQIQDFIESTNLPEQSPVSVVIDAIAMNPDRSSLPSGKADSAFVVFVQPLDRRLRCFPIHVKQHESGAATPDIREILREICEALGSHRLIVKYKCADGDRGHNEAHVDFFDRWYSIWENQGLEAALGFVSQAMYVPVGDFLHLWKNFCNKVKNHPVVISPDSLAQMVTNEGLQSLLGLGRVLTDKTATGRMRDSYPLKLFTFTNCFKCLDSQDIVAMMYLLPWTLQEEVIRSPLLSRQERLEKAILSFKLLLHYYHSSHFPHEEGVSQRFRSGNTKAITFAEDSDWPRILNSSIALVQFILDADEHWSFARLGTHCLENFFGFVRRNSFGDDRFGPTLRIIAKSTMVYETMHELGLEIKHRGRDNIGGTVVNDIVVEFGEERPEIIFQSLIHLAHLEIAPGSESVLLPLEAVRSLIAEWSSQDHHTNDPICNTDVSLIANCRITARNMGCSPQ